MVAMFKGGRYRAAARRHMAGGGRITGALFACLLAAACGSEMNPWAPQTIAQEQIGYTPGASTIYCYRTLAEVDCFDEPQPGPPNRFVSGYVYE